MIAHVCLLRLGLLYVWFSGLDWFVFGVFYCLYSGVLLGCWLGLACTTWYAGDFVGILSFCSLVFILLLYSLLV